MKFLAATALLFGTVTAAVAAPVPRISAADAAALVSQDKAVLVDVREPKEYIMTGVAAPAVLLPMSDFDGTHQLWDKFLASVGDKEIVLYCRSGHRAGIIADALANRGFKVANAGGLKDWQSAKLPMRSVAQKTN